MHRRCYVIQGVHSDFLRRYRRLCVDSAYVIYNFIYASPTGAVAVRWYALESVAIFEGKSGKVGNIRSIREYKVRKVRHLYFVFFDRCTRIGCIGLDPPLKWGEGDFFFKNLFRTLFSISGFPTLCQISRKSLEPFPDKTRYTQTDRQTDRQEWFYRSFSDKPEAQK